MLFNEIDFDSDILTQRTAEIAAEGQKEKFSAGFGTSLRVTRRLNLMLQNLDTPNFWDLDKTACLRLAINYDKQPAPGMYFCVSVNPGHKRPRLFHLNPPG